MLSFWVVRVKTPTDIKYNYNIDWKQENLENVGEEGGGSGKENAL